MKFKARRVPSEVDSNAHDVEYGMTFRLQRETAKFEIRRYTELPKRMITKQVHTVVKLDKPEEAPILFDAPGSTEANNSGGSEAAAVGGGIVTSTPALTPEASSLHPLSPGQAWDLISPRVSNHLLRGVKQGPEHQHVGGCC